MIEARDIVVRHGAVTVLHGVTLGVHAGERVALVGESGSGKSTLMRVLLGLQAPQSGECCWNGRPHRGFASGDWRAFRREVQAVFQDPRASLDPRMRLREQLLEPRRVHHRGETMQHSHEVIDELAQRVGIDPELLSRHPHELSGGQCQRLCIARALACAPKWLCCDEAVSSLDVSVRAQVVELLRELSADGRLGLLFITHDIAVARRLSTRLIVLREGRIVEEGATGEVLGHPQHPYTRELISAVLPVPR